MCCTKVILAAVRGLTGMGRAWEGKSGGVGSTRSQVRVCMDRGNVQRAGRATSKVT